MSDETYTRLATIENVSEKDGWYTIEADGKKYSTKFRETAVAAHGYKGRQATIEYTVKENTKDGKVYKNFYIKGVKDAVPLPTSSAAPSLTSATAVHHPSDKDDLIVRQTVVKAACDLLSGSGADKAQVLAACELLYGWVKGNKEVAAPKEVVSPAGESFLDGSDISFNKTV